jgi:fructokinase
MYDIIALGELLIDFTACGFNEYGVRLFEQNPGGAPANVLCAAANLGLHAAIIGKVGKDMHGDYLREVLIQKGVDTSGLVSAEDVFTTLAFVELSESGERKFSFARKPGADSCLTWDEVDKSLLSACRVLHFGSISLTGEPSRKATIESVKAAKRAGAIISYDPNYREPLWESEADAFSRMASVLPLVDVIKISEEEAIPLTGAASPQEAAEFILEKGVSCVVVTLGGNGAYAAVRGASVLVPAPSVPVVDTTGAGDAFCGGFLYKLCKSGLRPENLGDASLRNFVEFAVRVASHCVQKRGGIPAMPTIGELVKDSQIN